jgi:YfiH family protein
MRDFDLELSTGRHWAWIPLGPDGGSGLSGWISLNLSGDMGSSAELNNPGRIRLLRSLGIGADRPVYACRQVHSHRVVIVTDQSPESVSRVEADGLITRRRDAVLTVTVADCLPIYLVDRDRGIFSLVHSGWRGTGIAVRALERMGELYGSRPTRVAAVIGPGIGSCCYSVEQRRYLEFRSRYGKNSVRRQGRSFFLDLIAANIGLLTGCGVRDIRVCRQCTACTPRLSSYRREGEGFGHMLAGIGEL